MKKRRSLSIIKFLMDLLGWGKMEFMFLLLYSLLIVTLLVDEYKSYKKSKEISNEFKLVCLTLFIILITFIYFYYRM